VQEVYERLLRYRRDEPVDDPLAYLFKTAWNVLKSDNQRSRREQNRLVMCDSVELESLASQFRRLWVDDSAEALTAAEMERALSRLPRACRIALIRQRRDGYSYQQIADELHVSVNTVKDYIVRALNHCRLYFSAGQDSR
jgi:RNA polymerase sigma factor (sigma-70 family)